MYQSARAYCYQYFSYQYGLQSEPHTGIARTSSAGHGGRFNPTVDLGRQAAGQSQKRIMDDMVNRGRIRGSVAEAARGSRKKQKDRVTQPTGTC